VTMTVSSESEATVTDLFTVTDWQRSDKFSTSWNSANYHTGTGSNRQHTV